MLLKTQFQTLFAYNWHTTGRVVECAGRLDEAARQEQPGFGHGSIEDLLFHLLKTYRGWRLGVETGQQPPALVREDYPDLESLRDGLDREQEGWRALLERLDEDQIAGDLHLTSSRGYQADIPRWRILQHMVLHGMQHHTELAQLLSRKGQSPGDIDFIFYEG